MLPAQCLQKEMVNLQYSLVICCCYGFRLGCLYFAVVLGGENTNFLFGQQHISLKNSITGQATGTKAV